MPRASGGLLGGHRLYRSIYYNVSPPGITYPENPFGQPLPSMPGQVWSDYMRRQTELWPRYAQRLTGPIGAPTAGQTITPHYQLPTGTQTEEWIRRRLEALQGGRADSATDEVTMWRDWYRTMVIGALGLEPGLTPLDPLSQLREQLAGAAQSSVGVPHVNPGALVRASLAARLPLTQQAEASMGMPGAYAGIRALAQRAREALAGRAEAIYAPAAWEQEQRFRQEITPQLQALVRAQLEARRIAAGMGIG